MSLNIKSILVCLLLLSLQISAKADKVIVSGGNEYILHEDGTVTFVRQINDEREETIPENELFDFEKNEYDFITLTHYNGKANTVIIPEEYNNIWVTNIGERAFELNSYLEHISLPAYLLVIEDSAFDGCKNLIEIDIPENCMMIGEYAFGYCKNMKSVIFPINLIRICFGAFFECRSLIKADLEKTSLTYIENMAFSDCGSLVSVSLPNTVESIGDYAFERCISLVSINLPDSLKEIGSYAFKNCASINDLIIPKTVTTIGENAFVGCLSLTLSVYPNSYGERYAKDNGIRYRIIYT